MRSGYSASSCSIGLSEKFATTLEQASTPSRSGRPPHDPCRNSRKTNGRRWSSYPPMVMPVSPPDSQAGTRSGATLASAPNRNPVNPRAATAAGGYGFAPQPRGNGTGIGRTFPVLLGIPESIRPWAPPPRDAAADVGVVGDSGAIRHVLAIEIEWFDQKDIG